MPICVSYFFSRVKLLSQQFGLLIFFFLNLVAFSCENIFS